MNNAVVKYFKEAREELTKVTWPTRREAANHTMLVIVFSLAVAAFFGVLDFILTQGLEGIIALKK